jgi:SAM-dependent methyltransferase
VERYFSGAALYGDDFGAAEIAAWFADEREGYAALEPVNHQAGYRYAYHGLNRVHGFRHLPPGRFQTAVGLGAAYAEELRPLVDRIDRIIVIEPSASLRASELRGVPLEYREPALNGDLPLGDATADLVTCFGVLHHIPNVSHVLAEIGRVLRPGGYALIREPIVSMGDWREPRRGVTKRERGIPLHLFRRATRGAGLSVERETLCACPLTPRLTRGWWPDSERSVAFDAVLCRLTAWNLRYHATAWHHKIRPTSAFLVLRRA